jgi:hypothetical protein
LEGWLNHIRPEKQPSNLPAFQPSALSRLLHSAKELLNRKEESMGYNRSGHRRKQRLKRRKREEQRLAAKESPATSRTRPKS